MHLGKRKAEGGTPAHRNSINKLVGIVEQLWPASSPVVFSVSWFLRNSERDESPFRVPETVLVGEKEVTGLDAIEVAPDCLHAVFLRRDEAAIVLDPESERIPVAIKRMVLPVAASIGIDGEALGTNR
ncbi:hypothetical protein [Burkholderia ambifaria]|uniref:hypothetical protein n=1 Tax=Burkholderia ambifaria TaxID=152480 RepID=UPI00315D285E